jgi:peptidoglycan/xylan/chitin deacetylase (PgdA/CDA1 family)
MTEGSRPGWRPTPLISGSGALHLAAAGLAAAVPATWPLALAAVVVDQALLTAAGLWPRSTLLGPNWVRLPSQAAARGEFAITIDDGPDPEVTPRVLDLLDRYRAKVTFFCIGERAARHPELCWEAVRRGHSVENHSQRHLHHFALLGIGAMAREVEAGQETLAAITGQRPCFFRAPAGLRNPLFDPVRARYGVQLVSWSRRGFDTREGDAQRVAARLLRGLRGGDILLLHDGNAALTTSGRPVIVEVLPRLLEAAAVAGLHAVTLRSTLAPFTTD